MTPNEEWRPVVGFEDRYEVSSLGRVRSLDIVVHDSLGRTRRIAGRVRSLATSGLYMQITLKADRVQTVRKVHALVAEAFLGPRPDGMDVCHNNGDGHDNRLTNLRYDTRSNNHYDAVRHGTHAHATRTHCPQGHEYTPDNTARWGLGGGRTCRTCDRLRRRAT